MRWVVAGLLLFVAALALQLHFIAWTVVLVVLIWQLAKRIVRVWLESVSAIRSVSSLQAEIGQIVEVAIGFECRGRWPLLWALCEDLMPDLPGGREEKSLAIRGQTAGVLQGNQGQKQEWRYRLQCRRRGYFQLGPLVMETGDVFGMDRRFRVLCPPVWLLVRPQVVPLHGYDVQSRRPIGEIVMTHRLFEDPTRTTGVRQYQPGDPLSRIHWRATARTGALQSRVFEPTCLAGATVVVDFHRGAYDPAHEPMRSELAITAAASISSLLYEMNQQSGLMSNGRDGADRVREEGWRGDARTRGEARASAQMSDRSDRLRPVLVPPSKSAERLSVILDQLARLELTDGLTLDQALLACTGRLPRDASIVAIVSRMDESTAFALESMKRQGFAVTAIVNCWDNETWQVASGFLVQHGIHAFHLREPEAVSHICRAMASGHTPA